MRTLRDEYNSDTSLLINTIDHENLFHHLEKYVGISGNALKLIKSYFSGRTQRVMIDGILSDVASLICGVPQGSVPPTLPQEIMQCIVNLLYYST